MLSHYLQTLATELHPRYVNAQPFPFAVIDGLFSPRPLLKAAITFPSDPDGSKWWQYDSPGETKWAYKEPTQAPTDVFKVLQTLNSPEFVTFLETLTGIGNLIPDDEFHGGGLHRIPPGGKLFMHIDFLRRPGKPKPHRVFPDPTRTPLFRRVNALLYLNPGWQEAWGGHLELRGGIRNIDGLPLMDRTGVKILPVHGRLVVMTLGKNNYHGHPEPLTCPPNQLRCSLASYYFTRESPANEDYEENPRRALFWPRPEVLTENTPANRAWCLERAKPVAF